jgi:recombinational DNA repair ATPase RecF
MTIIIRGSIDDLMRALDANKNTEIVFFEEPAEQTILFSRSAHDYDHSTDDDDAEKIEQRMRCY